MYNPPPAKGNELESMLMSAFTVSSFFCLLSQFIQKYQQVSTYSTKTRFWMMRGVTGMVKMVTQDLHIPVTRQDRL